MKISIKKYIRNKVIDILSEYSGLSNNTVIKNLNTKFEVLFDYYLDFVEIIILIENEFGLNVDYINNLDQLDTPNKIIKYCIDNVNLNYNV